MSDSGLTTDTAPTVPPAGDAPAGDAPAGAPTDPLTEPLPDQPFFDRGYVDSIRKDAARYRVEANTATQRAQQYDDVFGQYEPQDQQVWFDLARTWATDPAKAAQVMQTIANGVLGETMPQEPDYRQTDVPDEGGDELTPEKVQELINQQFQTREAAAAEQKAIDDVMSEVRAQGYDPNTAEGFMVLWNANNQTGGDIKAAAEMVKGYRQGIIDEYVQGRSSGRVAMPTQGGVQATTTAEPIKTLEDARRATDAFLRERRGA